MIPLKINNKHLYEIFDPDTFDSSWTEQQIINNSIAKCMFPSEVRLTAEQFSEDAERTANYELEILKVVNCKAKPEFTWDLLRADYVQKLLEFLEYKYDYKNTQGIIEAIDAPHVLVTYRDFVGMRTIDTYFGQTLEGTLVEYDDVLYWENFRIAFPER